MRVLLPPVVEHLLCARVSLDVITLERVILRQPLCQHWLHLFGWFLHYVDRLERRFILSVGNQRHLALLIDNECALVREEVVGPVWADRILFYLRVCQQRTAGQLVAPRAGDLA